MTESDAWRAAAEAALKHYDCVHVRLARVPQGLINLTVRVTASNGRRYALQRLHPVFGDAVNRNLARVTAHLRARGMLTPELVPTATGAPDVVLPDGRWRLLTWIDGRAFDALRTPAQARAAGQLLGRFHAALADFTGEIERDRPPVHDLERHLANLAQAIAAHPYHRLADNVAVLAAEVEAAVTALGPLPVMRPRLVHGDPKISNVLFDADGRDALCLIDLDTLARMPVVLELGDALRSWCNPGAEDAPTARIDLERMAAAMAGYETGAPGLLDAVERGAVVAATLAIHVELAARFLADALDERYFGWDSARYPGRGEHNLARARGQLRAAASLREQRVAAEAIVAARGTTTAA
ncbi:MAG: phosphotransferase [Gammaproteobacteria bacterium]|nr:phosphotransferase [Gammaproteobacteria bacterium]